MTTDQAVRERREAVFDALGDATRRAILDLLVEGPETVGHLASALPVGRPAVSLHLKVLRDAGLVTDRADGTRRIYRLDRGGLELLRTYLDRMWAGALESFAAAAEAAHAAQVADPSQSAQSSKSATSSDSPDHRTTSTGERHD